MTSARRTSVAGTVPRPSVQFHLPADRGATEPPAVRDDVRLLVARPGWISHTRFAELPLHLRPGDVVVVNTSATLPAALDATWRGSEVALHLSTELASGNWVVEVRRIDGRGPVLDAAMGDRLDLAGGAAATLLRPDGPSRPDGVRLWVARLDVPGTVRDHLDRYGRPITYAHLTSRPSLDAYQTVFARDPGSAEMPSAGRPFTTSLVTELVARAVVVAPVTLHAGVSSLEAHEPPRPERFDVPPVTARLVREARSAGGRVVAVGTTVTRALETVADEDGTVHPGRGWTDLVLGADRPARVVTGLLTGWHEPGTSHLALLEAVAGPDLVARAYAAAVAGRYRWHEFGDTCLLLP